MWCGSQMLGPYGATAARESCGHKSSPTHLFYFFVFSKISLFNYFLNICDLTRNFSLFSWEFYGRVVGIVIAFTFGVDPT